VFALLILVPLVSWLWIVTLARDMYGPMSGASAWMMTSTWDVGHLALLWAMWVVMMTGMMLPSAAPLVLLYGMAARRNSPSQPQASGDTYALAAGYLLVWTAFSLGATALQRLLATLLVLSPMMETTTPIVGAALLLTAGLYQLSPIKETCLRTCQSPLGFLTTRWRSGRQGAFRMGLEHGAICVGCCWALMLLLFVGGVMNLAVIAALTVFVAFEKLTRLGRWTAWASGAVLIAMAGWMLLSAFE
jgi:predicted metal-binding membrane protein